MNNTIFLEHIPLVSTIWFSSDSKITRYGPARRNVYIIHYVLSGKGYFNGNEVKAGQGFLIRPNELEHYYPDEKDPWKYIWIISKDENMEYFFTQHNANPKTQIFAFKNTYALENVITILASSKNVLKYNPTHLTEYFLSIYNNCIYPTAQQNEPNSKVYVNYAINYIHSNVHVPITIKSLCEKIDVSQPYIYNIFKQETGLSPKQYISQYKIETSEKLLVETNLTISQIALQVGFYDVLEFSKFFKKATSLSPSDFRKTR